MKLLNYKEELLDFNQGLDKRRSTVVRNMLYNAKESGRTRDLSWLSKMVDNNLLKFIPTHGYYPVADNSNRREKEYYKKYLESYINNLNLIYGNNWDVFPLATERHYDSTITGSDWSYTHAVSFTPVFVIHFDKINMENSLEKKHVVKDLFVQFTLGAILYTDIDALLGEDQVGFRVPTALAIEAATSEIEIEEVPKNILYPYTLSGSRTTFTSAELDSSYIHSHLSSLDGINLENISKSTTFCTGSGEISSLISVISATRFDDVNHMLFLNTIKSLIEWESLEGKPYTYIKNIKEDQGIKRFGEDNLYTSDCYHTLLSYVSSNTEGLLNTLDYRIVSGIYRVIMNKNFHDTLKDIFIKESIQNNSQAVLKSAFYTVENGYTYHYSPLAKTKSRKAMRRRLELGKQYVSFREKRIYLKVGPRESKVPDINQYKVHKKLLKYVKSTIEQKLYRQSVKNSAFNSEHTLDNI